MAREEQEYTAECTATVIVYARSAQAALTKIGKELDKVCSSHEIESVEDAEGNDVTDGTDPEVDEDE